MGHTRQRILLIVLLVCLALGMAGCDLTRPSPQSRPAGPEGAARWAYSLALPQARSQLASDAVLVAARGTLLFPDGRIPANTGKWELDFSSFNAAKQITFTVDHTGGVTAGQPASPGVIRVMGSPPGTFPDSTAIFAATVGQGAAGTREIKGTVNAEFNRVAGSHVWSIPFQVGGAVETHMVRWDGIWLGIRP